MASEYSEPEQLCGCARVCLCMCVSGFGCVCFSLCDFLHLQNMQSNVCLTSLSDLQLFCSHYPHISLNGVWPNPCSHFMLTSYYFKPHASLDFILWRNMVSASLIWPGLALSWNGCVNTIFPQLIWRAREGSAVKSGRMIHFLSLRQIKEPWSAAGPEGPTERSIVEWRRSSEGDTWLSMSVVCGGMMSRTSWLVRVNRAAVEEEGLCTLTS